ncbi:MAG: hypothetical protein R3Y43_01595 [Alphaproteobacteria bacterium]
MERSKKNVKVTLHLLYCRDSKTKVGEKKYVKDTQVVSNLKSGRRTVKRLIKIDKTIYGYYFTEQNVTVRGGKEHASVHQIVNKRVFIGELLRLSDARDDKELRKLIGKSSLKMVIKCRTENYIPFEEDMEVIEY